MRKQNVIIFSAGESIRNGKIAFIRKVLEEHNICCSEWHDLFHFAHNAQQIALLPALAKKIPTFDFALIFAEGVDEVKLRGIEDCKTMRDNVLFELGLCVMGLGTERVILFAEDSIHLPDDLAGIGKIGIEHITFHEKDDFEASLHKVEHTITEKALLYDEQFSQQLDAIIQHINVNARIISPVFIGAAVSSAEAYFTNFIIRLLEHTNGCFHGKGASDQTYQFPKDFQIKIIMPTGVDQMTRTAISNYYQRHRLQEFVVEAAGIRDLFFHGTYDEAKQALIIYDIPSSITASYVVVNSILNIDSDDEYDISAEKRFITKEMDIYEYTLKKLFTYEIAEQRLHFIQDPNKKAVILQQLQNITILHADI